MGVPVVLVCTEPFVALARAVAEQQGHASLPIVGIAHPIGGRDPAELVPGIEAAVEELERLLVTDPSAQDVATVAPDHRWLDAPGDPFELLAFAQRRGIGDGLPILAPTAEHVTRMLGRHGLDGDTVLGRMPPSNREVDLWSVAANAVMAGCEDAVLPVVIAAVEATLDPAFNLKALQSTTHPVTPLVVVHGPVVRELDFNAGSNVLGQGNRSNATVGRAVRLVLQNVGDAHPGTTDRATHGSPAKYSYCMAESDAVSSWPRLHVGRGVPEDQSAVTVLGAEAPHNVNDHGSVTATGLLATIADVLASAGSNDLYLRGQPLLILSPEHAELLSADGFDREHTQAAIHRLAVVPHEHLSEGNLERFRRIAPALFDPPPRDGSIPMLDAPERLLVVIAGGAGKHSMVVPTFGSTEAVTVPVSSPSGR